MVTMVRMLNCKYTQKLKKNIFYIRYKISVNFYKKSNINIKKIDFMNVSKNNVKKKPTLIFLLKIENIFPENDFQPF